MKDKIEVPLIEKQMHMFLIDREEKRCRKLEEEYSKNESTKHKKVRRRKIAKPWERIGKKALCDEPDLLAIVSQYDYDLSNEGFQQYCRDRGIMHVAGKKGSRKWTYLVDYTKTEEEYIQDSYFHFAQEIDGKRYRYTPREMKVAWSIILLGRASLQDCWELYCKEVLE